MEQALQKLLHPGVGLMVVGAVLVYGSGWISKPFRKDDERNGKA